MPKRQKGEKVAHKNDHLTHSRGFVYIHSLVLHPDHENGRQKAVITDCGGSEHVRVELLPQLRSEEDDTDDGVKGNPEADDDGYVVDIQYLNETNQGRDRLVVRLVVKISLVSCHPFTSKLF